MKLLSILLVAILIPSILSRNIIKSDTEESEGNSQSLEEEENDENLLGSCYRLFNEDLNESDEILDSEEDEEEGEDKREEEGEDDEEEAEENEDDDEEIPEWAGTGIIDFRKRWEKNDEGDVILPYEIEKGYEKVDTENIKTAMKMIEKDTCVKFKERKFDDKIYLSITHKENSCFTYVGKFGSNKIRMAKHPVNFGKNICKVGRMAHEFIHTLGFFHMHQHPRRNEFVEILWENIDEKYQNDFYIIKDEKTNQFLGHNMKTLYDYDSILHYGVDDGSKNGKATMKILQNWTSKIGHNSYLSDGDVERINVMYNCGAKADKRVMKEKHDSDDSDDDEDSENKDSDENEADSS